MSLQIVILAIVAAQRLSELVIARRNTALLLEAGGYEVASSHYPAIVALHAGWLLSLMWFAPSQPVIGSFLIVYVILQLFRIWLQVTMGKRWTTTRSHTVHSDICAIRTMRWLQRKSPSILLIWSMRGSLKTFADRSPHHV